MTVEQRLDGMLADLAFELRNKGYSSELFDELNLKSLMIWGSHDQEINVAFKRYTVHSPWFLDVVLSSKQIRYTTEIRVALDKNSPYMLSGVPVSAPWEVLEELNDFWNKFRKA